MLMINAVWIIQSLCSSNLCVRVTKMSVAYPCHSHNTLLICVYESFMTGQKWWWCKNQGVISQDMHVSSYLDSREFPDVATDLYALEKKS